MTSRVSKISKASQKNIAQLEGHIGFVPPRYLRGKVTADALLDSGRQLLLLHSLDGIKIEEICSGAQVTTGAFYRRFLSKDAYFKALQAFAIEDSKNGYDKLLQQLDERDWEAREGVSLIISTIRQWYCMHEGVIRASQMQRSYDPLSWEPIKQIGFLYVSQVTQRVEKIFAHLEDSSLPDRIKFAFQVVFGTLVNAVINKPGPLALSDPALDVALTDMFLAYIFIAPSQPSTPHCQ